MPQIALDDLQKDAFGVIRSVQEERVEYVVTDHGQPVALIRPIAKAPDSLIPVDDRPDAAFWKQLDAIREEIETHWQSDRTAVELIEEQRREL